MDTRKISLIKIAAISFLLTIFWSASAFAQIIFQDGFETGDLSHTENGIVWGSSAWTYVRTDMPKSGTYSLWFKFLAVADGTDDWAEQRLQLNAPHPELWVMYDLYIPANYYHRTQSGPANNKFFVFWSEPYAGQTHLNFSTQPNGSGGSDLEVHHHRLGVDQPVINPSSGKDFITSVDLGRWHRIVIHVKVASSATINDGTLELWKNGVRLVSVTDMNAWGGDTSNYMDALYILGWSNSGFLEQTNMYVDNFVLSTTPLDGSGGNTPPPSSGSGGDSGGGSGGGSGCGFVKDDDNGKRQGAKGEGLSLIIMLIIALTGIALARKRTGNITVTREGALVMKIRKISLIKIAAISFLLTIFWSVSAYAQPQITSFSGSLTDKGTLVITGTGFGTKSPAAPLKWDDFEGGTAGNDLSGWYISSTTGINAKYADDQIRPNSTLSSKQVFTANSQYGSYVGLTGLSNTRYYITFYRYITTSGGASRNFKPLALRGGPPGNWDYPEVRHDMYPSTTAGHIYTADCDGSIRGDTWTGAYDFSTNAWHRIEYYIDQGNIGVANGNYYYWFNGQLKSSITNTLFRTSNCVWTNLYLNSYFATDTNNAGANIWVDNVYIDTTPARVEISDSPTWNTATASHKEIQVPSAWSDTSITITVNQGSFSNLNNAYLYVIDANGNVNTNGYLLSDGGGSGGGNTPPPSSGGGGDSTSSGGSGCGFVKDSNSNRVSKSQSIRVADIGLMIMLVLILAGIALRKIIAELKMRRAFSALIKGLCFFVVMILLAQIAACGSGGGGDSSNSSNNSSGGTGGGSGGGTGSGVAATLLLTTIGQYYTLQDDLTTAGTAVSISANDVTLDLNGKTITYNASSSNSRVYGVYVAVGVTRVTIKNGTILQGAGNTADSPAIYIYGASWSSGHTISDMVIRVTGFQTNGIQADNGYGFNNSQIYRTYVELHGDTTAMDGYGGDPITVCATNTGGIQIHDNVLVAGHRGIQACSVGTSQANPSAVYNNHIQQVRRLGSKAPYGILLDGKSHNVAIHDNQIISDDGRGINLDGWGQNNTEGTSNNHVYNNRIDVQYSTTATNGAYVENNLYGIRDRYASGDNLIEYNTVLVASNIQGDIYGMYIGSDGADPGMKNIVVRNNTIIARRGAAPTDTPYVFCFDYADSITATNNSYITQGGFNETSLCHNAVNPLIVSGNTVLSPPATASPAAPTSVLITLFLDSYMITWNANSEADVYEYVVYRDGVKLPISPRGGTFYVDVGINGTHNYSVSALTLTGVEGAQSVSVSTNTAKNGWW